MSTSKWHSVQFLETSKATSDQTPPAGELLSVETVATCNEVPATVTILGYTLAGGPFITSYAPTLEDGAPPPTLIGPGPYSNLANPLTFFNVSEPTLPQVVTVTGEATGGSCGTWPINGEVNFSNLPLSAIPFDFFNNTTLGTFDLSGLMFFGFGTEADPSFKISQTVNFGQTGYFGVIQLVKGTWAYQNAGDDPTTWTNVHNWTNYMLDVRKDLTVQDYILQRQTVTGGVQTLRYTDAPGIYLDGWIAENKNIVAAKIDFTMQTYFMFNPSASADPNSDTTTIWYPIGVGIEWAARGAVRYNGSGLKTDFQSWTVDEPAPPTKNLLAPGTFPSWTQKIDANVHAPPYSA